MSSRSRYDYDEGATFETDLAPHLRGAAMGGVLMFRTHRWKGLIGGAFAGAALSAGTEFLVSYSGIKAYAAGSSGAR